MILFVSVSLAGKWAGAQQTAPSMRLDLDQAVQLALAHNHALRATRTQIQQSQAAEITAGLRPNPVLNMDYNFLPIFSPSVFSVPELQRSLPEEFDTGIAYTIERGHKRQARVQAARDQTAVTQSQVQDSERALIFNVAQQFVGVLFAKSTLEFAEQDLASFQHTVDIGEYRYKAGDISKGDQLKIQLQLLQFQTDVSSAQLALIQALANLRQLLGYDAVPENYDVIGELTYTPLHMTKEDLEAMALKARPDLIGAERGVTAAQSQNTLAKANGKRDLTVSFQFSHAAGVNAADFAGNIEIPIFTRNQGEIARTHFAIGQAEELRTEAQQTVITDVVDAYEGLRTNGKVVEFYQGSYLKQSEESLDISQFAYSRGAASLLDFLDAERSYRSIQLAYRQALSNCMLSLEQVREAVGKRNLP
jgi:cobalt-zinc-cadmium efflux system outer membrane protein